MLDLFLIAEIAWCTLLMVMNGARRALLYSAGILTSGFAASQFSGWFAKVLLPPAGQSFLWLQSQLSLDTQSVSILSGLMPAEPVLSGLPHGEWITLHIVKTLFFVAITCAVFLLFVVASYLSSALYDRPGVQTSAFGAYLLTPLFAAATGLYAAVLTGLLLGNLAWLHEFAPLRTAVAHSLGMHWIAQLLGLVTAS